MQTSNLRVRYNRFFALAFVLALFWALSNSLNALPLGLDDGLWIRQILVSYYADLRLALGDRVFPKVLVGKDGWLVFTGERSLDDYQNSFDFPQEKLIKIQRGLTNLNRELESNKQILLLVIVPNKSTIYPESVPFEIQKVDERSRMDRLSAFLKKHGPPVFLDLRPVLKRVGQERQIYYKTDTHWNSDGAFVAYQAIIGKLQKDFPELKAKPRHQFKEVWSDPVMLDLAYNIGSDRLREPRLELIPTFATRMGVRQLPIGDRQVTMTWTNDESFPRLVMYHDSFGFPLIPLLGMHFRESVFIPHYSGSAAWQLNWIRQEAPDVVIIEFAERYLHDLERLLYQ